MRGAILLKKTEKIKEYYEAKIKNGLEGYQVLGWESEKAQHERFNAFVDNIKLEGLSLLDVGCGIGSFYEYLSSERINVEYFGVDILSSMIDKAKEKHPEAQFICSDIFKENIFIKKQFDAVYASGMFNLELKNNREFLSSAVLEFTALAKKYVGFSLLHINSPNKESDYCYYDPSDILQILKPIVYNGQWSTQIVEGYLNNDFTVILTASR